MDEFIHLGERDRLVIRVDKVEKGARQQHFHFVAQRLTEGGIDTLEITVRAGNTEQIERETEKTIALGLCLFALSRQ